MLQVAGLLAGKGALQRRLDTLQENHTSMLQRMADVTSKWQATVAENAQLHAALAAATAELAQLQQQLLPYQQQWPQQY